jgi:SpoVK/Ycf46/Vps4 family AAA+-type ATPase
MTLSANTKDLTALLASWRPIIVIESVEEERIVGLLRAATTQVQTTMYEWSVTRGLVKTPPAIFQEPTPFRFHEPVARDPVRTADYQPIPGTTDPLALLRQMEDIPVKAVFVLKDFSGHLDHVKVARHFREVIHGFAKRRSTVVLTGSSVELPREIDAESIRFHLRLPDQAELIEVINTVLQSMNENVKPGQEVQIALTEPQRLAYLRALQGLTLNQARQVVADSMANDRRLAPADIQIVLRRKVDVIREDGLLEYSPAEDNDSELGGFSRLRTWLARAHVGFTPEARAMNLKAPRGVLLIGVPGCGKSLAAKVIAREWSLPLLKLDAGRLYDKYVGESEKKLRKAMAIAESLAPVVLWIDEIEKGMVSSGGNNDADAGLSRRLFGAFLTWLQEKRQEVFVVATANDLSAMPPELLRKGRFDEIFFVDLPNDEERRAILRIHLAARNQQADAFDLNKLAAASEGFSGAELEQAVVSGLYEALYRKQPPDTALLLEELSRTLPLSVSRKEEIEAMRRTASGRFVGVR